MNIPQQFRPGEVLNWLTRSGTDPTSRAAENRSVFFVSADETSADHSIISWGWRDGEPRKIRVPTSELSRGDAAPIPREFLPAAPMPKRTPPTSEALTAREEHARSRLRQAHLHAAELRQKASASKEIADRGATELGKLQAQMLQVTAYEQANTRAYEYAIREGKEPPFVTPSVNGVDRTSLETRLRQAEAACERFNSELAECRARLNEALTEINAAARNVVSALVSVEAEELRRLTAEACRKYAQLHSVSALRLGGTVQPLPLDHSTADLLGNDVVSLKHHPAVFSVSSETWTRPWTELFQRLVSGEAEADWANEQNSGAECVNTQTGIVVPPG